MLVESTHLALGVFGEDLGVDGMLVAVAAHNDPNETTLLPIL